MCLVQTSEHNFKFQELNTYREKKTKLVREGSRPLQFAPLSKEVSLYLQLITSVVSAGALVISGFISHYKLDIDISDTTSYIFFFSIPHS